MDPKCLVGEHLRAKVRNFVNDDDNRYRRLKFRLAIHKPSSGNIVHAGFCTNTRPFHDALSRHAGKVLVLTLFLHLFPAVVLREFSSKPL